METIHGRTHISTLSRLPGRLGARHPDFAVQRDLLYSLPWSDDEYFQPLRLFSKSEAEHPLYHIGLYLLLLNGITPKQWLPNATGTFLTPTWSLSLEW